MDRKAKKAAYLSSLPKDRWKRLVYRMHPKRVVSFVFSREGGILTLKLAGIGVVVGFIIAIGAFAYFRKDLPKINDLSGNGGSIRYYDRTGTVQLWQDYDAVKRTPVASDAISPFMKQATIAIEDKNFYNEGAFDLRGIMRAAIHNVVGGGETIQGGSTITQQLVKLSQDWSADRTVARKIKELILSVQLEKEYSKTDILTGYLNMAPYGGLLYGVESAARDYFGVSAKDLTLAQSAMLSAIPQSPNYYSPYGSTAFNPLAGNTFNKGALIGRQHYIIDQMVKQGYIKKNQASAAKQVDILAQVKPLNSKYSGIKAPYFVLAAKNQLLQKYSAQIVAKGGWKIITTLDMSLQEKAEQLVANNLPNVKRYGGDQEATIVQHVQTGQIQALVGGVDFSQPDYGQLNFAAQVLIPPGSSFKPYDYTALINNQSMNAGAGSVLYDTQGPIIDPASGAGYKCTNTNSPKVDKTANCLWNYDFRYPGPVTLRYAIGGSRNIPAVKAMIQAGVNNTINLASAMMNNTYLESQKQSAYNCYATGTDLGSATPADTVPCYPSSAIGDGAFLHLDDHVNGLATLARMGVAIPKSYILQINDAAGNLIYKWTQPKGKQVVSADTAYIMNNMLSDPNASYMNSRQKFHNTNGWNFAIKTGTTNDNFDGLMTSWSTQFAVVSWVGHHTRNKAMSGGAMENMTAPLTRGLMEFAHAKLKPVNWIQPSTIKTLPAYVIINHVGLGSVEPSTATDIYPGWYQPKSGAKSQATDKVSGLLATSCTPELARSAAGDTNINAFSIDKFIDGSLNKSTTIGSTASTDNVHICGDSLPQISTPILNSTCTVGIVCNFTVTATAGSHPFNDVLYSNFPGTINLLSGRTILATKAISDNNCSPDASTAGSTCTVTISYAPTGSGTVSIIAQVIDSVLYSATSESTDIIVNPAASAISITSPQSGSTVSSTIDVVWTGGSGLYSVTLNSIAVPSCQNISLNRCDSISVPGISGSSHTVGVTDSNNNPAGSVTFSR